MARSSSAIARASRHHPGTRRDPRTAAWRGATSWSLPQYDCLPQRRLLVVYTDGVIERRGEGLAEGIERLASRVNRIVDGADLASEAETVVRDLAGTSPHDDVALVL